MYNFGMVFSLPTVISALHGSAGLEVLFISYGKVKVLKAEKDIEDHNK